MSRARSGERANHYFQDVQLRNICLSASVPALGRTRHPFAVSDSEEPSQKIEFVFSASPETIRREPREFDLLRSVGNRQDLAVCAFCSSCLFRQYLCCRGPALLLQARNLSVADPRQADTRPSSGLRRVSLDSHFLSAFPCRRSRPAHGSVSEPAWQLRPVLVGYACYAVSKAAYASPCRPSSVHLRRGRSS